MHSIGVSMHTAGRMHRISLRMHTAVRMHSIGQYHLCKFCFANRIVNILNSLPSYMVSAETVNCFKTRLDRFWLNQDI